MLDLIKRNMLKYTLLVDGAVCTLLAFAFLSSASLIAGLIGPAFTDSAVIWLGAFLLLWGVFHLAMSAQVQASAGGVKLAIIGDAIWIAGSVAILVYDWQALTALGATFIAIMAAAVVDIMLLKIIGLGRRDQLVGA